MRFLATRLMQAALVILAAATLSFILMFVVADPITMMVGLDASAELRERMRVAHGFDRPLLMQYASFMSGVVQGDFGQSLRYREPVMDLMLSRAWRTAQIAIPALLLAIIVSIPAGILAAQYRNLPLDYLVRTSALMGQAAPNFWIALMLVVVLSLHLGWLPASGYGTVQHMIMPVIVLSLPPMAYLTRIMRASILETTAAEYVRTARAKGLFERIVMYRHILRNALIPYTTLAGLQMGSLLAGSLVVENVFAWPGLGRLTLDSVTQLDIPVVAGALTMIAVMYVTLNLIVDIIYVIIDPRLRRG